jgi:hypothetical protein
MLGALLPMECAEGRRESYWHPSNRAALKMADTERRVAQLDRQLHGRDSTEFSSPSAAAAVIHGGSANALIAWKTDDGKSLKQLDEQT